MSTKTIALIVVLILAFACLFLLFATVFAPKLKKNDKKKPSEDSQPEANASADTASEPIPEILTEVTRRNYMQERAIQSANKHEFNLDDMRETRDDLHNNNTSKHRIQPIEDDGDQDTDLDQILNSVDGNNPNSSIKDELKNLSPSMKAIIMADALKRKDE